MLQFSTLAIAPGVHFGRMGVGLYIFYEYYFMKTDM